MIEEIPQNLEIWLYLLDALINSPEFKKLIYAVYVAIIFWAVSRIANIRVTWELSGNTSETRSKEGE